MALEKDTDIWNLACKIAEHHAFEKHGDKFNNPEYGVVLDIREVGKLAEHVYQTLVNKETKCFRVDEGNQKGSHFAYNDQTNTAIVFSAPENPRMPPTAHRPDKKDKWFDEKHERATKEQQGRKPEITRGIQPLMKDIRQKREKEEVTRKEETSTDNPTKEKSLSERRAMLKAHANARMKELKDTGKSLGQTKDSGGRSRNR
jgi:hypothetical protein